ncbi:hypothetical protein EDB81DRAFT_811803, partial [Dactylonectria macrodidyma]
MRRPSSCGVYLVLGAEACLALLLVLVEGKSTRSRTVLLACPCFVQGAQSNCNWKVVLPFSVMRLSEAFSSGHSSNLARTVLTSVSSDVLGWRWAEDTA